MLTRARGSHCPGSNATHPCRTGFRFCRPNRRSSASERSPQRPPTTSLLVRRRSSLSSTSTTKASNCPYRRGPLGALFLFTASFFQGPERARISKFCPGGKLVATLYDDVKTQYDVFCRGRRISGLINRLLNTGTFDVMHSKAIRLVLAGVLTPNQISNG